MTRRDEIAVTLLAAWTGEPVIEGDWKELELAMDNAIKATDVFIAKLDEELLAFDPQKTAKPENLYGP